MVNLRKPLLMLISRLALKIVVMTREQGTGNREQGRGFAVSVSRTVLGNFTFRYLCRFFSVHLLNVDIDYLKES